jgi:hypothetical protein
MSTSRLSHSGAREALRAQLKPGLTLDARDIEWTGDASDIELAASIMERDKEGFVLHETQGDDRPNPYSFSGLMLNG